MDVLRVTAEEYTSLVLDRRIFFNEPVFCELNRDKVDEVYYLIFMREKAAKFGLILGRTGDLVKCPFSASYSYPVEIKKNEKLATYDEAVQALENYCISIGVSEIRFTFPPMFYDEHILSAWISSFYRCNYELTKIDVNYAIDLEEMNVDVESYGQLITAKGRKSLRRAQRNGLTIQKCETEEEYAEAYEIVKMGHEFKGFPVRMSFEQLMDTMKLVDHDVFIVRNGEIGIVAEFLYRINKEIVQGIYTGTLPDHAGDNGMNMLTYFTINYYGNLGYKILNKEIATEDSIPNYGLCDFKESVGCRRSLKYSFKKSFKVN
ncbi:MAG: hypothetical protein J6K48_00135 [Lachnospiraceae bacterium]|nr:hypothetical protein [Lachnospiraceae bacterium]